MSPLINWDELEKVARAARENAYAPYSRYTVGAAILDENGNVYGGSNVENATYGLTVCAERGAVSAMITAGGRVLRALLVVTGGREAGSPCGACRQTLAEFCEDAPIQLLALDTAGREAARRLTSVDILLPDRFHGGLVLRP